MVTAQHIKKLLTVIIVEGFFIFPSYVALNGRMISE
jgi:hypothetical protein